MTWIDEPPAPVVERMPVGIPDPPAPVAVAPGEDAGPLATVSSAELPGVADLPAAHFRRRRSARWWATRLGLAALFLLVDAAVLLFFVVARYQPVASAGGPSGPFPGAAPPAGTRMVNDFGGVPGQLYVPPQLGTFSLRTTVANVGSHSVSILAMQLYAPSSPVQWPFVAAGPIRYRLEGSPAPLPTWTLRNSVELSPHESFDVALPVRFADTCFLRGAYATVDEVWVEEQWLWFRRWVQLPIGPVIVEDPEPNPGPYAPKGAVLPDCLKPAGRVP